MARTAQAEQQAEANEAGEIEETESELSIVEDAPQRGEAVEAEPEQAEGDERVAGGEEAEARDTEREERRLKRRRKKERIRTEMNFLRARNEQLERRFSETDARITGTEVATIDARISEIDRNLQLAETVLAGAHESKEPGSGKDLVAATKIRDELRDAKNALLQAKDQTARRQEQVRNAPPAPDPEMLALAREFKERNPWYDFDLRDAKSRLAKRIDDGLSAEGLYRPNTQEYWDELEARLARRPELAKHFDKGSVVNQDDDDEDEDDYEEEGARREPARRVANAKPNGKGAPNGKAGGPRFTSGGRERPLRKNEVYVSRERREAMEELGVWDDPVLRKRYLAQYQKWDRDNAG